MTLDVSTTGKAQGHLRNVRADEERVLREHWVREWRERRCLPPWLRHHHRGSAARKALRGRTSLPVTTVEALLTRACEDEAKRRVARLAARRPEMERGRELEGDEREVTVKLGSYTEEVPCRATA